MMALQANLSTAQEFIETSLQRNPGAEEKIAVLHELDAKDAELHMEAAHSSALKQVEKGVALLQVAHDKVDTLEFVQTIGQKLGELNHEQDATLAELEKHYLEEFKSEAKRQE